MDVLTLIIGVVLIPAAVLTATVAGERLLGRLSRPVRDRVRPWFWIAPVIAIAGAIIAYPVCVTFVLSFRDATGKAWNGIANFSWVFGAQTLPTLADNLLWVVLLPIGIIVVGLSMAVLIDRVRYEIAARTLLVLPTAISLTAAAISWQMLYAWSPQGTTQLGLFNAVLGAFNIPPIPWTARPPGDAQWLNTISLVAVSVWAGLGIAVLILSAAVKAVPAELLEAARLDGASEWRTFWGVTLKSIWPSVLTVLTTQVMAALKIFDVVYVMTNGNSGTQVVANTLVSQLFNFPPQLGRASALAVVLMACALPVVWYNIRSIKREASA